MAQLLLLTLGALAVVAGVALLSIPAALIIGGTALAAFALLWDFDRSRTP